MRGNIFLSTLVVMILAGSPLPSTLHGAEAQERIRIGVSGTSPGFLPTVVAEKKGFYAK